jgi:hypothetical protein
MKALRIIWIVAIVLLFPLIAAGFFTHISQKKEKEKIASQTRSVEIKIEKLQKKDPDTEELKRKGMAALKELDITKDNWWYLGELEGINKKFWPVFRNISASKIKEEPRFTKYSRLVKMTSSFPEVLDLISNLENSGGFQIEGLEILANAEDSKKHNVEFWLSFSRVKQAVIDELSAVIGNKTAPKDGKTYYEKSLRLKPVWKKNKFFAGRKRGRDPFTNLKKRREEWLARLSAEQDDKMELSAKNMSDVFQQVDVSQQLVLKGILSFRGIKMAVLDAKYKVLPGRKNRYRYNVRTGDFVGEKKVVKIDNKRVVLRFENTTYYTIME